MEKLVIFGTGSLTPEVVDFIERYKLFEIIGFTVDNAPEGKEYNGLPVFPTERLEEYIDKEETKLFVAISWYNYHNKFKRIKYEELKNRGFHFANLISPNAIICTEAIGEGNWINDCVHIGYNASIGNNNVFLVNSMIFHHSVIGNHNTFVGAKVAGHVICRDGSFFGVNSTVYNRVIIGNRCVIGGGAIVKKDLPDFSLCVPPESFVKQCTEEKIETYISPKHVNRSVESFEKCREELKGKE